MLFGVIFARSKYKPLNQYIVNHERIHTLQAKREGGWIRFYLKYLSYSIRYGYKKNPYEIEANKNEWNLNYK